MKTFQTQRHSHRFGAEAVGLYSLGILLALLAMGCGNETHDGPGASSAISLETHQRREAGHDATNSAAAAEEGIPDAERPAIVFLGTSLTAGYGLQEDQAFPALVGERLAAEGRPFRIVNAGVSGDTSAGGLRRLDWLLRLPIAVLVLELGANDMLRGQSPEALEQNLTAILDQTRAAHPKAQFVIAGMRAAPNLGAQYRNAFDGIYPALAERYDADLVPFLLEDVAAKRELNQADGIHPTAKGHALIADRVYAILAKTIDRL